MAKMADLMAMVKTLEDNGTDLASLSDFFPLAQEIETGWNSEREAWEDERNELSTANETANGEIERISAELEEAKNKIVALINSYVPSDPPTDADANIDEVEEFDMQQEFFEEEDDNA